MKKVTRVVAIMMVCALALVALAACGPDKDPKKAKQYLSDCGYTVALTTDANLLKAEEELLKLEEGSLEAKLRAAKSGDTVGIVIYYCSSASAARAIWSQIKEREEKKVAEKENYVAKCSGKMVWYGSTTAEECARY